MKKLLAPQTNCWQAFLACMTDIDLNAFASCSTEYHNWQRNTAYALDQLDLFYVESSPLSLTAMPQGALVGARVEGLKNPHVVVAKVIRHGEQQAFEVYHDPSGKLQQGTPINPDSVVLFCRFIR